MPCIRFCYCPHCLHGLRVSCRRKHVIESLLERRRFSQRPIRLLLMHKDDIIENRLGYAHHSRQLLLDILRLEPYGLLPPPGIISSCRSRSAVHRSRQSRERHVLLLLLRIALRVETRRDVPVERRPRTSGLDEVKADSRFDMRETQTPWVVYESSACIASRWEFPRERVSKTLDNGRLARSIRANDKRQRSTEDDFLVIAATVAAYAANA